MNIVRIQEHLPVFEVQGFTAKDLEGFLGWLKQEPVGLPLMFTLDFNGVRTVFNSPADRLAYAAGFLQAVDAFFPEPTLGKWTDNDGDGNTQVFVNLASSKNKEALQELANTFLREMFLTKWFEHDEEICVHSGYDSLLLVRLDLWYSLSRAQKCELVNRARGFTDAVQWQE